MLKICGAALFAPLPLHHLDAARNPAPSELRGHNGQCGAMVGRLFNHPGFTAPGDPRARPFIDLSSKSQPHDLDLNDILREGCFPAIDMLYGAV